MVARMAIPLAVLAAMLALASAVSTPARPAGECINNDLFSGANSGAFPSQFQIISASGATTAPTYTKVTIAQEFEVSYYSTYKVVYNKRANETYVLVPCGLTAPAADNLPAGAKVFEVPLVSASVSDTSVVAFMNSLGVLTRVRNVTEYSVNSCMQSLGLYGCKRLDTSFSGLGADQLAATDSFWGFSKSAKNPKAIAVTAVADPGVLNRAEWIKFVATFYNKEDVANEMFAATSQNYNNIKAAVAAAAKADVTQRPLVAWLYYQPPNPDWGIYGREQIAIQFAAYMSEYALAAGGRMLDLAQLNATVVDGKNVTLEGKNIVFYNMETAGATLAAVLKDVDVAIDLTRYPNKRNADLTLQDFLTTFRLKAADVQNVNFLRGGALLRVDVGANPDGYTDWYEGAVAQPDLVLRDLASVITPAAVPANTAPRFVRNLLTQKPLVFEAQQCPLTNCQAEVKPICPLIFKNCAGRVVYATAAQRCAPDCTATQPGTNNGTGNLGTNAATSAVVAPAVVAAALLMAFLAMLLL
uniref:Uncharacterized protein n=1 Tax=Chlamydomonas leiostraca TaxID=1034604 RepID=A0A7S0WZP8_9CHLO